MIANAGSHCYPVTEWDKGKKVPHKPFENQRQGGRTASLCCSCGQSQSLLGNTVLKKKEHPSLSLLPSHLLLLPPFGGTRLGTTGQSSMACCLQDSTPGCRAGQR